VRPNAIAMATNAAAIGEDISPSFNKAIIKISIGTEISKNEKKYFFIFTDTRFPF
jgi:hypothetical protein